MVQVICTGWLSWVFVSVVPVKFDNVMLITLVSGVCVAFVTFMYGFDCHVITDSDVFTVEKGGKLTCKIAWLICGGATFWGSWTAYKLKLLVVVVKGVCGGNELSARTPVCCRIVEIVAAD